MYDIIVLALEARQIEELVLTDSGVDGMQSRELRLRLEETIEIS